VHIGNRGNANAALRKIDDAIADYDQAIAIKPQGLQTLSTPAAKAYVAKGDSNKSDCRISRKRSSSVRPYVEAYEQPRPLQ